MSGRHIAAGADPVGDEARRPAEDDPVGPELAAEGEIEGEEAEDRGGKDDGVDAEAELLAFDTVNFRHFGLHWGWVSVGPADDPPARSGGAHRAASSMT